MNPLDRIQSLRLFNDLDPEFVELAIKTVKALLSCTTPGQLDTASAYMSLALPRLNSYRAKKTAQLHKAVLPGVFHIILAAYDTQFNAVAEGEEP